MLEPTHIYAQFPSLKRTVNGKPQIYFDGPGGTQVTQSCIDGMVDYLTRCNANHGGVFASSAARTDESTPPDMATTTRVFPDKLDTLIESFTKRYARP